MRSLHPPCSGSTMYGPHSAKVRSKPSSALAVASGTPAIPTAFVVISTRWRPKRVAPRIGGLAPTQRRRVGAR